MTFVLAYAASDNGKQSAIEAGYSVHTAAMQASRLLTRDNVVAAIERVKNKLVIRHEVTLDWVITELKKIAGANMGDYFEVGADGLPRLNWSRLTRDQKAAMSEVTVDIVGSEPIGERIEDGAVYDVFAPVKRVRFKLHDKRAALVDLGKHLGLFDGHEAGGDVINVMNQVVQNVVKIEDAGEVAREYLRLMGTPPALPKPDGR
jgi:phage terminase small subunit